MIMTEVIDEIIALHAVKIKSNSQSRTFQASTLSSSAQVALVLVGIHTLFFS